MSELGKENEKEKIKTEIILLSDATPKSLAYLDKEFFNAEMEGKVFAYLPCVGDNPNNPKYSGFWKKKVKKEKGLFSFVNNAKSFENSAEERKLVEKADYLMIPGGNTFVLLDNLRKSGLFNSVREFFNKGGNKYLGISAGAIILGPSIEVAGIPGFSFGSDENTPQLKDMSALGIIGFVPVPHYVAEEDEQVLESFKGKTSFEVKPIADDEVVPCSHKVDVSGG